MADLNQMPHDPLKDIHDDPVADNPDDAKIADDHPQLDSNIDTGEKYDEGLTGAGEIPPPPEPNVADYHPDQDERRQNDNQP